jgi:hypothetical protein
VGRGEPLAVIAVGVHLERQTPLVQPGPANRRLRTVSGPAQRRKQQRHQQHEDGDDHQQLDQGEAAFLRRLNLCNLYAHRGAVSFVVTP